MMEPLPSSPIDPGRTTTVAPSLQRTVAVAPMRTAIMTTAGLARKTADWSSVSVAASDAAGTPTVRSHAIAATTRALAIVGSYPSEPLVALVLPVPAIPLRTEVYLGEILHHLVSELHRGVYADRRSVVGAQRLAVHAIRQNGLRVESALSVPRRPVARVEGSELYVARARIGAHHLCQVPKAQTVPGGDRRPPLDAVMAHAEVGAWHPL